MYEIVTILISKRVNWNIFLANANLSLSHFSADIPLHLHLDDYLNRAKISEFQTSYHRFKFTSLIDGEAGVIEQFPEDVCRNLTSLETLKVDCHSGKQSSILINSSCETLHTVKIASDRINPEIVQNYLVNLKHLTLQGMRNDDNAHILLKKCANSITYLTLENVSLNIDGLDCDMRKLETLHVKEYSREDTKLVSLLSKCSPTLKYLTLENGSFTSLEKLEVEMPSLQEICVKKVTVDGFRLDNLLNHSTNLQQLTVHYSIGRSGQMKFNQYGVKRLILKNNSPSFDHRLIKACTDSLESLDINILAANILSEDYPLHLSSSEWFLPKLKEMHIRGRYSQCQSLISNIYNHVPPEAHIQCWNPSMD